MSGFGGGYQGNNNNNNNNNSGGGGYQGGRNSSGRGGRNSGGRGGRSSGRNSSGRGRNSNNSFGGGGFNSGGGGAGIDIAQKAKLRPCGNWTTTGACQNGQNCKFSHAVKLHASVDAGNPKQSQNNNNSNYQGNNNNSNYQGNNNRNSNNNNNNSQLEPVTAVAVWETAGTIKIFTGSHDGFWRLWNTSGGTFVKEFEQQMGGKVECLQVAFNYLFCGFEGSSPALPGCTVGMVHAWNLAQPTQPPLELQMAPGQMPYAHGQAVTSILIMGTEGQPPKVVSGSRDGTVRIWAFKDAGFAMERNLLGHAREVTGLAGPIGANLIWSGGMDNALRIWDCAGPTDACQHAITTEGKDTAAGAAAAGIGSPTNAAAGAASPGSGHTAAITALLQFEAPGMGTFVLSSSLDGTVQAWNGTNGQCVASEQHGEGVICMSMGSDLKGSPLLLVGLESGNIMVRNILQTPNMPAFGLLFVLNARFTAAHSGPVRSICQGPSSTFYSCGNDGKMMVWQMTGDVGL